MKHESQLVGGKPFQCPCCDYFSLPSRGDFDICRVCFWEDDGLDVQNLDACSGPNHMTLRQARRNFDEIGACEPKMRKHVLSDAQRALIPRTTRLERKGK